MQFVDIIHKKLQDCTIYFIAISPAPARWNLWEDAKRVNHKIKEYAKQHKHVIFIETSFAFLNTHKEPVLSLFDKDGIHLNNEGYAIWAKLVSAAIVKPL